MEQYEHRSFLHVNDTLQMLSGFRHIFGRSYYAHFVFLLPSPNITFSDWHLCWMRVKRFTNPRNILHFVSVERAESNQQNKTGVMEDSTIDRNAHFWLWFYD